jgi:hypothetical protein
LNTTLIEDEQGCISPGRKKPQLKKASTQASIPSTRGLLQTIDSTLQLAYMRGKTDILKTRGLLHIDIFCQKTMEKSIADVNLTKGPASRNS